jgi:hypothetical protein
VSGGPEEQEQVIYFEPITLGLLGKVFDKTLQAISDLPELTGFDGHSLRQALARRIIACARTGERDPDRLRNAALADVRALAAAPGALTH